MTLAEQAAPEWEFYTALGYATLLTVWAAKCRSSVISRVMEGRSFDSLLWLWWAGILFNTADMLKAGRKPWEALP